jgi:hypothetical protein
VAKRQRLYGIKAVRGGIEGLDEAIAKLEAMPEAVRAGMRDGLTEITNKIKARAHLFAAGVDPQLASAIESEVVERDGKVMARVFVTTGKWGTVPMPVFLEMGTGPQGIASKSGPYGPKYPLPSTAYTQEPWYWYDDTGQQTKDHKPGFVWSDGMEANPYLWPAFLAEKPFARDVIIAAINRRIRALKAGGGGA